MKKNITPDDFNKLEGMDRLGWTPVYIGYKTKMERNYSECDCCGNRVYQGWIARQYPIGEPLHYEYHTPSMMERASYEMMLYWSKSLTDRVTFNKDGGESKTINFTRYSGV